MKNNIMEDNNENLEEKVIEPEVITTEEEKVVEVVATVEEKKEEIKQEINSDTKKEKEAKDMGLISLILGAVSIVMCCCSTYMATALGIAAIILGAISNKKYKNGMATAGLVLGIVSCCIFAIIIVIAIIYGMAIFSGALVGIANL